MHGWSTRVKRSEKHFRCFQGEKFLPTMDCHIIKFMKCYSFCSHSLSHDDDDDTFADESIKIDQQIFSISKSIEFFLTLLLFAGMSGSIRMLRAKKKPLTQISASLSSVAFKFSCHPCVKSFNLALLNWIFLLTSFSKWWKKMKKNSTC